MPREKRPLSLLAASALVVANMIGVGIFTSTGYMAAGLSGGVPVLVAWALGGVLALCGAATYAELGAMMPRAGGEYAYLSEAYRPWVGFLSGWVSLIVGFSAPIAAAANAFGSYLHLAIPGIPSEVAGVVLIGAMTGMHSASVAIGAGVQTAFAVAKVALIVVFIGAVFFFSGEGSLDNVTAGAGWSNVFTSSFAVSLVYVAFSYSGWNAAAYVGGEIRDPGRNIPRALLIGTGIVTLLYLSLNAVFLYAAPTTTLSGVKEVGELAARSLFGDDAGRVLSLLIAFALVSSVSAMVMTGPRVYMAMAEDGLFFRFMAKRARRGGAPVGSILLQGALAVALLLIARFEQLIYYIGFTLSISAALTCLGVFVLRVRRPDAPRPYRTWGYPWTPTLFIALSAWMVVFLIVERPQESLWGAITLLLGVVVFLLWNRHEHARSP